MGLALRKNEMSAVMPTEVECSRAGSGLSALAILLVVTGTLAGCARYEYSVVQPQALAGPIGTQPSGGTLEPLRYQFQALDRQLGIGIINPTDSPVTLVGSKSYVVDPQGQSHSLQSRTIAPGSYVSFALPPQRLALEARPTFSFGFGYGYGYHGHYHGFYPYGHAGFHSPFYDPFYHPFWYDPFYDRPRYDYFLTGVPNWEWETGEVTLRLFYEMEGKDTFDHQLIFLRRRVD